MDEEFDNAPSREISPDDSDMVIGEEIVDDDDYSEAVPDIRTVDSLHEYDTAAELELDDILNDTASVEEEPPLEFAGIEEIDVGELPETASEVESLMDEAGEAPEQIGLSDFSEDSFPDASAELAEIESILDHPAEETDPEIHEAADLDQEPDSVEDLMNDSAPIAVAETPELETETDVHENEDEISELGTVVQGSGVPGVEDLMNEAVPGTDTDENVTTNADEVHESPQTVETLENAEFPNAGSEIESLPEVEESPEVEVNAETVQEMDPELSEEEAQLEEISGSALENEESNQDISTGELAPDTFGTAEEVEEPETAGEYTLNESEIPEMPEVAPPEETTDAAGARSETEEEASEAVLEEAVHISQSDAEALLENTDDAETLRELRDRIEAGEIQIDADATGVPDEPQEGPALTRDASEQWEAGNNDIDAIVDAMRDDLRDKGLEDGPEMESIVMAERTKMLEELGRNIEGDFSSPYVKPDFHEVLENRDTAQETGKVPENLEPTSENAQDVLENIDYNRAFEGLESYDFDGIDYSDDPERLDASLDHFQSDIWENLSVDEQKDAMNGLAEYVEGILGFEDPPNIVYYNNPVQGDYGGYYPSTNTLRVNEHMLYENEEAADTIAHELWHAYQHERAKNPSSEKDYLYQYGFENYISPQVDFTAYQDQLIEAEARAFAQQFKDRLRAGRRNS